MNTYTVELHSFPAIKIKAETFSWTRDVIDFFAGNEKVASFNTSTVLFVKKDTGLAETPSQKLRSIADELEEESILAAFGNPYGGTSED